jgi:hypothetical protein
MLTRSLLTWTLITILSAFGGQVLAQGVTTASMSGLVTDEKGEGLPGATVAAVHTPSGTQYATGTRGDGRFNLPNLRVGGPYTVTITFVGYQEFRQGGINLSLGQDFTVNAKLSSADVQLNEVVVTSGAGQVISQDRTGASTNISNEQITKLPTLNRSFNDFTRLTPQANNQSFGGRSGSYNNITIDGALFNNAFGLSGTVGGQANAQPISLDAIDQIQVNIAPFDVRQGTFTGAGINAVTRGGTNEFQGSAYYYLRGGYDKYLLFSGTFVGDKISGQDNPFPNFSLNNMGFRLGGPIIKNKLFFFVNAERERRSDPVLGNWVASASDRSGPNVSEVAFNDLETLSNFLQANYNYNTGPFEGYSRAQDSDKATVRLDWNASQNHRVSVKYNYLKSYRDVNPSTSGALPGGGDPSRTHLPYYAAYYRINNNLNSIIGEVNSTFGTKFSNNFTVGYTGFRDFRESPGGVFPLVSIGNGAGQALTTFGYEPFSANNILNTDVFQISNNFTIYAGKHTVTVGTYNEFYKFKNGFAPNYYGAYQFASLADFYSNATQTPNPATPGVVSLPLRYELRYAADGGDFPFADIRAQQYGLYAQDEIALLPNLKITAGLRADVPVIPTDIEENEQAAGFEFRGGERINTSQFQKASVLWSPRVGFNLDVFSNKTTQLRGGTGIFTGRIPYVWISNQASNNGLLFGSFVATNTGTGSLNTANYPFTGNVDAYRPANPSANPSYNLAVTEEDFKFPQVWRTNLAIDQVLPLGIIGTLEAAYTKDLNAVYHVNANLPDAPRQATPATEGGDDRPIFFNPNPTTGVLAPFNRINGNITDAIIMKNTNKGYSYFITAQLQKTFTNGFFASAAYTYSDAKSVNDGGSIAQSIWRDRVVSGDPNDVAMAINNFVLRHRVVATTSYRKEYAKFFGSSISFIYVGSPAPRSEFGNSQFSYTYAGDMNGDGSGGGGNDLIWVPRDRNDIVLRDITYTPANGGGVYTADEQWADLDAYIEQDKYLRDRRGQYAERNGATTPYLGQLDVKLLQDFFIDVAGKRNTLQFSLDIFNFGNLLNSNWGVYKIPVRTALIQFVDYNTQGQPTFRYQRTGNSLSSAPLRETFQDDAGIRSRWQMQFGVRYIFN